MGYLAKDRVGDWSGDLEIVARAERDSSRQWTWQAICRRKHDGIECGQSRIIRTSSIGEVFCCRECATRVRAEKNTGRSKYEWTPRMDAMIRRIHLEKAGKRNTEIPSYAEYARELRRPKHAVIQRARKLGLEAPQREENWSETELRLLQMWGWMTPKVLQQRLKKAGFNRSLGAVTLKRKRLALHAARTWLNARELAEGLGIDSHKVALWVERGILYGNWREYEPGEDSTRASHQGEYVFHEKAVRRFILMNPNEIDLRKVDKFWFFDVITFGNFGESYRDPDEERAMKGGRMRGYVEKEKSRLLSDSLIGQDEIEEEYEAELTIADHHESQAAAF